MKDKKIILFDSRWCGSHGIGRFASEVLRCKLKFKKINLTTHPAKPLDSLILTLYLMLVQKKSFFFSPGYNSPLLNLKKTVITIHDLNHIDVEHNSSILKKIYYNFFLKRALKQSPAILTVSNFTKNRIKEWAGVSESKIFVVSNGVSKDFNKNAIPYSSVRPYFLVVGNRKKHKNEISALKAFVLFDDKSYDIYFTGIENDEMKYFIKNNDIENNVRFLGTTSDKELASIYKGAVCLLFPSLYEGFGLPVIESMACGTPVITSNITSMPEISGDAAILVDPFDIQEIKKAMSSLTDDEKFRNALINRGIEQSNKFRWETVRGNVERVFDYLLK